MVNIWILKNDIIEFKSKWMDLDMKKNSKWGNPPPNNKYDMHILYVSVSC